MFQSSAKDGTWALASHNLPQPAIPAGDICINSYSPQEGTPQGNRQGKIIQLSRKLVRLDFG